VRIFELYKKYINDNIIEIKIDIVLLYLIIFILFIYVIFFIFYLLYINKMEEKKQTKEDFCPICVAAVPLAFGVSTMSNDTSVSEEETGIIEEEEKLVVIKEKKGRSNNFIRWLSIFLLFAGLISLILILR
jgi:hypothetical protein